MGATCRGKSVVDWMWVDREMKWECTPMWVEKGWMAGEGGRRDGDHGWLRFDCEMVWGDVMRMDGVSVGEVEEGVHYGVAKSVGSWAVHTEVVGEVG